MFDDLLSKEKPFYRMVSEGWENVDITDLKKGDVFYSVQNPHDYQLAKTDPYMDNGELSIITSPITIAEVNL
jgi:hypothetical protein